MPNRAQGGRNLGKPSQTGGDHPNQIIQGQLGLIRVSQSKVGAVKGQVWFQNTAT